MNSRLKIEFQNTRPLEEVEFRIRREFAHLEKLYNCHLSCRTDIEAPKHEHRGSKYRVRVDLSFPRQDAAAWAELEGSVYRQGAEHIEVKAQSKDPSMAVHAAFKTARQRLEDVVAAS